MDSGQHRRLSSPELMLLSGSSQGGSPRMHREVEEVVEVLPMAQQGAGAAGSGRRQRGKMTGSQAHRRWCSKWGEKDLTMEIGSGKGGLAPGYLLL
jgi:hypothetical protein